MSYPPSSWPYPSPNPPVSGDIDETARWGEGTPLPIKMADHYQGKATGVLTALTVSVGAVGLPRDPYAVSMVAQVQGAPIRWTVDGTVPSSTVGFRADPGVTLTIMGPEDLMSFQAIREGGVDAVLVIQPFV